MGVHMQERVTQMAEVWATLAAFGLLVAQDVVQRLRDRSCRRRHHRPACPAEPEFGIVLICPRQAGSFHVIVGGSAGCPRHPGTKVERRREG